MNVKKAMPLVLAVVLGLVAMVMARRLLKPPAVVHAPSNTTPVVVATRDVPPGKELTAEDLAAADVPSSVVPAKAFTNLTDLVGRVATTPLVKGQAVLETLLAPVGAGIGLGALVPEGMRAMTMNVDEITGVGGMINPGCHVDVNVMVPDERTKQQTSRTVLQDLKVVAVGKQFTAPSGDASGAAATTSNNVTFLVYPDQARMLELAASTARPWLTLRSGRDKASLKEVRTLMSELHGDDMAGRLPETQPATAPADTALADASNPSPRRHDNFRNVEVIRGSNVLRYTVPMPADLGGSGLPMQTGGEPAKDGGRADKGVKPGKPDAGRPGTEAPQSPRPSAVTDVDQSDVFKADPFNTGSSR